MSHGRLHGKAPTVVLLAPERRPTREGLPRTRRALCAARRRASGAAEIRPRRRPDSADAGGHDRGTDRRSVVAAQRDRSPDRADARERLGRSHARVSLAAGRRGGRGAEADATSTASAVPRSASTATTARLARFAISTARPRPQPHEQRRSQPKLASRRSRTPTTATPRTTSSSRTAGRALSPTLSGSQPPGSERPISRRSIRGW